jgi:hypothetical protein
MTCRPRLFNPFGDGIAQILNSTFLRLALRHATGQTQNDGAKLPPLRTSALRP